MRSIPEGVSRSSRTCVTAASRSEIAGMMRARSRSPASLSPTLRVVRFSSRAPSRSSSWRIVWLSADGETRRCSAAREKLLCSATAAKAVSSANSLPRILYLLLQSPFRPCLII